MTTLEHEVKPPDRLPKEYQVVWREVAPHVADRLNAGTARSFEHLVSAIVAHSAADKAVRELPPEDLVVRHSNGSTGVSPLEKLRLQRSRELRSLMRDWGLSPDTAPPYVSPEERAEDAELAEFLAGGPCR